MSNKVNTISCAADWANTGFGECPWHMFAEGFIQVPKDAVFTEQQLADLVNHVRTKIKEDNKSLRFYPWPDTTKVEISGGDPNKEELDNGGSITTWENDYTFSGEFLQGGVPLNNSLRTRNGQDIYFIGYGREYAFGSYKNGLYKGFEGTNYWSSAQKPGAYKTKPVYMFSFNAKAVDLNERVWYVKAEGIGDVTGLKSLELKATGSPVISATGLVTASLKLKGYGDDYLAAYPAIGGLTFTAKNTDTGGAITVTTTSIVNGDLNFDLDHTDTDYPAIGGKITISGPGIAALEGAGVLGAEILDLVITRP